MKLSIKKISKPPVKKDIVLLVKSPGSLTNKRLSDIELAFVKERIKKGEELISVNQFDRWIFVALLKDEKNKKNSYKAWEKARKNAHKLFGKINECKISSISLLDCDSQPELTYAFAEGLALSAYQFLKYFAKRTVKEKKQSLKRIEILCQKLSPKDIDILNITSESVYIARDLVNEPVSYLTAPKLADEIKAIGKDSGLKVEVFGMKKIRKLGMGGLLAVNKGSIDPPRFSIITWKPKNANNKKPIVLVGKGIVYDTGGLSLKPTPNSMDTMKCDMGGAATIIGTMRSIAKAKLPVYAIGLIPSTDNRPDGNAYAPGDVIEMYNGLTVEALNTDAEGRMILADALSYAEKFNPKLVIDAATLTGAAHVAIGSQGIVAMGNADDKIMDHLKESGRNVYERIAEFPFWDEYDDMMKSDIADLKNLGGRTAGAITAGKFLEHFTDSPYIHLDIAGPAFLDSADSYRGKGGSGTGVRLLFDFIKNNY